MRRTKMKEKKGKETEEHAIQNRNGKFSVVTLVASLVTIAGFGLTNLLYTSSAMSRLEQRIERVRQESSQNYGALNQRIDKLYQRVDGVNQRIDNLAEQMDRNYKALNQRMDAVIDTLNHRIDGVNQRIDGLYKLISEKKDKEK